MTTITYTTRANNIDWQALTQTLISDSFDNGRTPSQLRLSFENSFAVAFALLNDDVVGKARALSDGVCNAYIVDVWTRSDLRRRGVASRLIKLLLDRLEGQHVYLFTDDSLDFYSSLGFQPQGVGMGRVAGAWLQNESRR